MQYPIHTTNIVGTEPHLSIEELMALYDKFTALGLMLLPRTKGKKYPISKYWKDHQEITRDGVEKDQVSTNFSGWNIVTGERSGRLIALDFDTAAIKAGGLEPQAALDQVQALSPSQFVFQTPSGGVHVLYQQPEDQQLLTNSKTPIAGLDKRGEGGQIASVGSFYRYVGKDAENKGLHEGHGGYYETLPDGDYSALPEMSAELYQWLVAVDKKATSEAFGKSTAGEARIKKHFQQPKDDQERIVISALGAILTKWGLKSYEEWLRMWMSAHHASGGSINVRDYILAHDDIVWRSFDSYNDGGRTHFREVWATHEYREGGYTASSLFWLARQAGWMSTTGYELNPKLADSISVRYVGEWLATLKTVPRRLLLMSQTGSGKTYSLKFLYEKLDHPKTVIFVPSIKLALELTATLVNRHDLPATCYYSQDTARSISAEEMVAAPILVTTLQTFSMKVRVPMENYGLVYIEESDQLIAGFARGGGGVFSTHVSSEEAKRGFAVLRDAFMKSGTVWCVDATMSQVTYKTANEMSHDLPIRTVINTWMEPKAPVFMVDDPGRALQEVLRALGLGKKVVCVSDTARQAAEIVEIMETLNALDNKRALVITRNTENEEEVHEFMADVNGQAAKYDLLSYNSVMASGVSITDFEPDVIVQFCTYLTPRVNLQLLNRYRNQSIVYCFYRLSENLYTMSDQAILDMVHEQVTVEGRLINMPVATRNDDASLRDAVGAISIADAQAQEKAPRDFYMHLLKADGREVESADATPVSDIVSHARKIVTEMHKIIKEELKSTWALTPPISREEPVPKGYTDLQITQGEIHEEIRQILRDHVPTDVDPKHVYEVTDMFRDYASPLTALIYADWAIRKTEEYLADNGKSMLSVHNTVSLISVVSLVRLMYGTFDATLTGDKAAERAGMFLQELAHNASIYDQVITRKPQQYEAIASRNLPLVDTALAYSKVILAKVGLKQRAERTSQKGGIQTYAYRIVNFDDAVEFLSWRSPEVVNTLAAPSIKAVIDTRMKNRYLTQEANPAIMEIMRGGNHDYYTSVKVYEQKGAM